MRSPTAPEGRPSKAWVVVSAAAYGLWLAVMIVLAVLRAASAK